MRRFAFYCALVFFVAGCSSTSFVGRRWDNFTAFYNTFHNARTSFDQGVRDLNDRPEVIDVDLYLPVFGTGQKPTNEKPFQDAVVKSAQVLRAHPDSKWMDDALMLIGKSYYYQQNWVGAEQKFREVISVSPRLSDEARFWLARTLVAGRSYDEASAHLTETMAREDLSRRWEPLIRLSLAELYVKREDWEQAATELQAGLEGVRDSQVASRAQFLLGQVFEQLGRYDDATAAYEQVARHNPLYELGYSAQLSAVRVRGLHLEPERALGTLRRMERDGKHFGHRAEMAYVRALILRKMGEPAEAEDLLVTTLYDRESNAASRRGQIHYALGEIYRDDFNDYVLAAAHFDTSANAINSYRTSQPAYASGGRRGGAIQVAMTPVAIRDPLRVATAFKAFARVRQEITLMDSLLHIGALPLEEFQEVVHQLRVQKAEELKAETRAAERLSNEQQFGAGGRGNAGAGGSNVQGDAQAGFLFHRNQTRTREMWDEFVRRWGDRPLVPNWRRMDAVMSTNIAAADSGQVDPARAARQRRAAEEAALPPVDVSRVPRDTLARNAMLQDRALARYELGNVLFLSMNRPDSAAAWYRMVIEDDAGTPQAARAYYALAEVQRALKDTLAARRLEDELIHRYAGSDLALRVQEARGIIATRNLAADSLGLAEQGYAAATDLWQKGNRQGALLAMVDIARRYPRLPTAPRALWAAGAIATEWAKADSLGPNDRLPLVLPDSVARALGIAARPDSLQGLVPGDLYAAINARYPKTEYADRAGRVLKAFAPPATDSSTVAAPPQRRARDEEGVLPVRKDDVSPAVDAEDADLEARRQAERREWYRQNAGRAQPPTRPVDDDRPPADDDRPLDDQGFPEDDPNAGIQTRPEDPGFQPPPPVPVE